jgi:thymidylate kinase
MRRLVPGLRTTRHDRKVDRPQARDLLFAVRELALAWDRRRLLRKARQLARRGETVVCDRYPTDTPGAPDSPRLATRCGRHGFWSGVWNLLVQLEERLYADIPEPDLVFRLRASVETVKARNRVRTKPDKESDEYVEARYAAGLQWQRRRAPQVVDIDAEQSAQSVLLRVKSAVWERLG